MAERAVREWPLRRTSDELRARYLRSGLWTDDTLGTYLDTAIRAHAHDRFRIWSDVRPDDLTLGTLLDRAHRLAAGLAAHGIGPGDVAAFQLPNWTEAAVTFFGLALLGVVVVPIVGHYGSKEVGFALRESRARAFVTADRFKRLDYLANLETLRPSLPDLELAVVLRTGDGALPAWALPFERLSDASPMAAPAKVDPDAPAVIGYTSGTTADPKGVIHTHRSLLAEIRQLAAIQLEGDRPNLIGAPVAHAIGMLGGLLLPIHRGQAVHLTDQWNADVVLDAMLHDDLVAGSGATVFLLSLIDNPRFTRAHAEKMRWLGLGSAPVPVAVADRAEELGIAISRVYGSTEHPSTTGSPPTDPRDKRTRTDGAALAGVELRVVDERGRDVPSGVPGEVWSRGPDLFAGYTDPALTRDTVDPDGWYASGDIAVLDADGYLTITDRKKDIIIRGGANISAAEIEELLARMPSVTEVAVVAAPDPRLGERASAFVRLRPGAGAPDLSDVQLHLEHAGLARQKWPEELHVVEEFPRTPSGKVKKYELRDRLRAARGSAR